MALQVWLPLNGKIRNQGLKKLSVTNNGATVNDNGKIGKCYYFNGNAQYMQLSESLGDIYSGDFTWALWLKPTDDTRGVLISEYSSNGSSNVALELQTNRRVRIYWDGNPDYILTYAAAKNEWTHLAVVKTNNLLKIYANGALVDTKSGTLQNKTSTSKIRIGDDYRGGNTVSYMGYLNDVRIYDNALSEQDIKELYWGKVFEFTPKWVDTSRICDASGLNFPLTPHNLTADGNAANFNGSSSKVEFDGLKMTGGTISIWFSIPAKPTVQRVLYFDPVSKIVVGFLSNGNICAGTTSGVRYLTTGITWGQLTHVVIGFNTSYAPQYCLINGVQAGTNGNENWSNSGTRAAIGVRLAGGANNWFNGSINEIKVFSSQLTVADAKTLYEKGPCTNNWGELSPVEGQFIRLTGTQYFDSLLERRDDYTIEVCIQSESQTNDSPVFGLRTDGSKYQFVLWQNTNVLAFWLSNSAGTKTELKHTYNPQTDLLKKQVITCNRTTLKIDGAVVATAASKNYGFPSSPTIKLFTLQTGTGIDSRKFKGKVYYVKVWNGSNELIRHWVPKIDTTKGVGLFDIVNNVFYENKGTGVCTIGHD